MTMSALISIQPSAAREGGRFPATGLPGLLTVEEVADLFGCTYRAVYAMADCGRVLALSIGRGSGDPVRERLRFFRASLGLTAAEAVRAWAGIVFTADTWLFAHGKQALHPREAELALRCSAPHVRALVADGELAAWTVGAGAERTHLRIDRRSVSDFVIRRARARNGF